VQNGAEIAKQDKHDVASTGQEQRVHFEQKTQRRRKKSKQGKKKVPRMDSTTANNSHVVLNNMTSMKLVGMKGLRSFISKCF
jgi:hypothetical protein